MKFIFKSHVFILDLQVNNFTLLLIFSFAISGFEFFKKANQRLEYDFTNKFYEILRNSFVPNIM